MTEERRVETLSGWLVLVINIALLFGGLALVISTLVHAVSTHGTPESLGAAAIAWRVLAGIVVEIVAFIMLFGYFTLQPNEARVLILFGSYRGTVRTSGFHWANPFYARSRGNALPGGDRPKTPRGLRQGLTGPQLTTKLSLRAHNFNSDVLKVNDKRGNPVEIASVIVWRVKDTAQAAFDVEDYASYVEVQSEAAIRSMASRYAYDHGEEHELTLRGGTDEIALALKEELEARLAKAGVAVEEARLTHLAYAPEIAPVMLRRQQAEAIIAARRIIVQNAVSMVHMALNELDQTNVVRLDEERRAAMVSNLLVVLCGTNEPSPVINTGTLYT
jgi:regulator of protease activity HflC (stomatin/prohibitin superfamily)